MHKINYSPESSGVQKFIPTDNSTDCHSIIQLLNLM